MKRSKAVVVGGAVLTLLGMLLSYVYTQSARQEARAEEANSTAEVTAWVAGADLTIGSTWEDISLNVSRQQVPAALRPSDAIGEPQDVSGKTLVRNVAQGEVLTATQFNNNGAESLNIPEGTSALTLSLDYPQGVGDYIQPGSKANIFVTIKGEGPGGVLTQQMLGDIPVLSNRRALSAEEVAEGRAADDGGQLLLTFAVTLEQAEKIIFAKENGSVWLTLQRPGAPAEQGIGQTFGSFLL